MKRTKLVCLLAILIFFAFGMRQATHASISFDEGPHLAVGITVWQTGDFRLQPIHIHPPLANLLAALPTLFLKDMPDPASIDGWNIASLSAITDALVWQYPAPARLIVPARVPILLIGVLLLAIVYTWTRAIAGETAATIALFLLACDPNLIAHSALVTTDTAAVFTMLLTLAALSHYAKSKPGLRSGFGHASLVGLAMGLAQLAKTSGTAILPFVAVVGLWRFIIAIRSKQRRLGLVVIAEGVVMLAIAFGVLWAGYGFQVADYHGITIPAATHLRIFESFREHYDLGHSAFAVGRLSESGWRWYFPLAFAIKTPLTTLAALLVSSCLGIAALFRTRGKSLNFDKVLLLAFIIVYSASSVMSTVNIGYRHLLPLLPALAILIGIGISRTNLPYYLTNRAIFPMLLLLLLIPLLRSGPYPLTFFNALIGDQSNAANYLVDSNLDWGQNWWDLRDWQSDHNAETIKVAHYSPAHLDVYGIHAEYLLPSPRAEVLTPWAPEPGNYAIGATVLQGSYMADPNTYAWFRSTIPETILGNALYVYMIDEQSIPTVLVNCTSYDDTYIASQYGRLPDRVLSLDCDRSEVYIPDSITSHYLIDGTQSITAAAYEILALRNSDGIVSHRLISVTLPYPPIMQPVDFAGPLRFMGYNQQADASGITLQTYWQVIETPSRPLSLMAHLRDANNMTIAVDDGLGFPIEQWQPGDILVQKHIFTPPVTDNLEIDIGAYWLDTMERWQTDTGDDHLSIPVHAEH